MRFTSWNDTFRLLSRMVLLIFLVLLVFSSPAAGAEDPIRIGATVSHQGRYQSLSYMVRNGYELWAEEVNSMGGLLGRKIELLFYDDQSLPERAKALYEKLITVDKVDMVLSPYGSTLTMAVAPVTEKHGYVLLAGSASSVEIWEQGFRSVFGVYSTADRYFLGFLDLAARRGFKNVGVVYSNTTFNISATHGVKKWANLFGLEVLFTQSYDDYIDELPAIADNLQPERLENLIFCGYPPEGYFFLEQLKQRKIKPPGLALTIVPALPDFYDKTGSYAENIFGPSQWEPDERLPFPGTANFIQSFVAKTGRNPSYQACSSYSSGQILERAITQAGEINHEKIRSFITSLDTVTIMGRFKVNFAGKQIGHNPILIQWQDGNKEIVYPTKMRTAPARFSRKMP